MNTTTTAPTIPTRSHLNDFLAKVDPARARLIFAIDATASRQPTWDLAAKVTAQIFGVIDGHCKDGRENGQQS